MPGSGKRFGGARPAQKGVFNARTAKPVTGNSQPPAGANDWRIRGCGGHHERALVRGRICRSRKAGDGAARGEEVDDERADLSRVGHVEEGVRHLEEEL